jgi:hypothetical protein
MPLETLLRHKSRPTGDHPRVESPRAAPLACRAVAGRLQILHQLLGVPDRIVLVSRSWTDAAQTPWKQGAGNVRLDAFMRSSIERRGTLARQ